MFDKGQTPPDSFRNLKPRQPTVWEWLILAVLLLVCWLGLRGYPLPL